MRRVTLLVFVATACAASEERPGEIEIPAPASEAPVATSAPAPVDAFFAQPGAPGTGTSSVEPATSSAATASAVARPPTASVAPPPAGGVAPGGNRALAEQLFSEGRALMDGGQLSLACVKFEQSMAMDPALGTQLNIGACHEKAGRKTQACEAFRRAARMAQGNGDQRARFANERVSALGCPP